MKSIGPIVVLRGRWQRMGLCALAILFALFLVAVLLASAGSSAVTAPESSAIRGDHTWTTGTVRVEFTYQGSDPVGAAAAADTFADLLSQAIGLDVQASTFPCEAGVVEHLGDGRVDLAPLNSVAYVMGRAEYGIEAHLVNGHFGNFGYRGQINVYADHGFNNIWDLQDTRFAASSVDSWSSYIAPYLLISETTGMTPTEFFGEVIFVGTHNEVIRKVYTGSVECGATYEDARFALQAEYEDVLTVVDVLSYTRLIPNGPWAFRPGLEVTLVQTLTDGIIAIANTPVGDNALDTIFESDLTGIGTTQDDAYDMVRDAIAAFGFEIEPCYSIYLPLVIR